MANGKVNAFGGQVTIDTILNKVRRDSIQSQLTAAPAGSCQLGRLHSLPRKAWGVLNKWALEILSERGSVDVPNFARMGWQRFRALNGEMRLRPVFILSESFCRAHGLPHKRILRPPLFKKAAEVVNYSKLAIRYTTSMTKDMVYGALREVFRGIGEAISSGAQVSVALSFGVLEAKERKFRFIFDCAALCGDKAITLPADITGRGDGEARPGEWDRPPSSRSACSTGRPPSTAPSVSETSRSIDHRSKANGFNNKSSNQSPSGTPSTGSPRAEDCRTAPISEEEGEERKPGLLLGEDFDKEVEQQRAEEVADEWARTRGSGKRTEAREKVWMNAFRDHVTALEGQAEDDMTLATRSKNLQLAVDRRNAQEREKKQREMHDLLTFVQGQIHEIEEQRALEVDSKRNGENPLTFSARRDMACKAVERYRDTAWRAPDWGPRRARASNLSREDLHGSLQRQIREREEERARKNRSRLAEEKAAIDKSDREHDAREERKRAEKEEAQLELKRSWESHKHLTRLRELARAGPAAVRSYALSQKIIDQDVEVTTREGGVGARTGWMEPGPRALTGPSKLYMKGLCKYRPCADESVQRRNSDDFGSGDGWGYPPHRAGPQSGDPRRPSTSHSATSSIGFDSRLSARIRA